MLSLSRETDYALQLIGRLSKCVEAPLSLAQFSQESTISVATLQKVARQLKQAGIVLSKRGKAGGYHLALPIQEIKLLDVVEAIEGKIGVAQCVKGECLNAANCSAKQGIHALNNQIVQLLASTTADDFFKHKTYAT